MKNKILSLAVSLIFAASATSAFAVANWVGNSAVNVNGTWYYCGNNQMSWCTGGSFNGGDLGEISALYLGGQSQVYENGNVNWNGGSVTMYYSIDGGASQTISLAWYKFESNNNFFQSGGEDFEDTSIDISGFEAGSTHTIAVWFNCDEKWDNNYNEGTHQGDNYVATFTKKAPTPIASAADITVSDDPVDVQINGLTLYKDTYWNTLCLPFSLTKIEIETSPLAGAVINELSESTLDEEGTLTLNFSKVEDITAGTPYTIKWESAADYDVVDPIFTGVILSVDYPGYVDGDFMFTGCFEPTDISGPNFLYLGAENTLYYSESSAKVGAFRAYFENYDKQEAEVKAFVLNFDDDNESTGIKEISNTSNLSNSYITLDGRRLTTQPTSAGLYIVNGKKVVIK